MSKGKVPLVVPVDPNQIHATIPRQERALVRQLREVQAILQNEVPEEPQQLKRHVHHLEVQCRLLRETRLRFDELLTSYEQITVGLTEAALVTERDAWGDLAQDALGVITEAEVCLQEIREAGLHPAAPPANDQQQGQGGVDTNMSRLLDLIERQEQRTSTPISAPDPSTQPLSSKITKLPKLELTKFEGDVLKWRQFWDRFQASVDSNPQLAAVDKMNYLISLLEGEALRGVELLPLTNDSYAVAVASLKKSYGDPKRLIGKLYRRLNELKAVPHDHKHLRKFVSEIDCLMGSISALGKNTSDDNFATLILSKLPEQIVMHLEIGKPVDTDWTVALVREKLSEYLIRLERSSEISAGKSKRGPIDLTTDSLIGAEGSKGPKKKGQKGKPPKKGDPGKTRTHPTCAFCEQNHYSDKCQKFPDATSRYRQIRGKRCFNCLSHDHKVPDCQNADPCYYCSKSGSHHSALCRIKFGKGKGKGPENSHAAAESQGGSPPPSSKDTGGSDDSETGLLASGEEVLLQTAIILVRDGTKPSQKPTKVRALLDSASNRSYCSEELSDILDLEKKRGPNLLVNRFGADKPKSVPTKSASLMLEKLDGSTAEIEVAVVKTVSGCLTRAPVQMKSLDRLTKSMTLADSLPTKRESGPINLLIGNDHYLEFISGKKIEVSEGLYLLESVFGWMLTGRVPQLREDNYSATMCGFAEFACEALAEIAAVPLGDPVLIDNPPMKDMYSLDSLGITDDLTDSDDDKAIADFEKHVSFDEGRYSVSLPFNENVVNLESDYKLSLGRLKSVSKKLEDDSSLRGSYSDILKGQLDKGVIEKVERIRDPGVPVHYIPHHAVVKPERETTKVRMVFDGSAKTRKQGASLNECLYRGPILLEDLAGLLIRFRLSPIAIIADIEKAFLQIGIRETDRDYLRFLWLKDAKKPITDDNIQEYRFARVPFGLNCSPSLLAQTVKHHLDLDGSPTAQKIQSNLYVDNVITGADTVSEALAFYSESKDIFNKASMNLRSWSSNSDEFLANLPGQDKMTSETVKVLGLNWSITTDTLCIQGPDGQRLASVASKRDMLSVLSAVFDPIGLVSPCTVKGKVLLQQVTQDKKDWDEPLTDEIVLKWRVEVPILEKLCDIKIPRSINVGVGITLIAFTDASATSFATAIYMRSSTNGVVSSNLIFSKSRLNPVKKLTIPRSELMGILIGKRALKFCRTQLRQPVSEMILLSDSQVALSWLKCPKESDTFVRNRVKEIQSFEGVTARYVHTEHNPADWATRGKGPDELNSFWWNGPSWIRKEVAEWPNWDHCPFKVEPIIAKAREINLVSTEEEEPTPYGLPVGNFSTLSRLLRVTAWCNRFRKNLTSATKITGCLTAGELSEARLIWDKYVQRQTYPKITEAVKKGRRHDMAHLGVFVDDDGLLRVKGRLSHARLEWSQKFPKLMPKPHPYTKLLALEAHARNGHSSVNQTLNQLRGGYWVPKGRSLVQHVIRQCVVCRKAIGQPYGIPDMPELPSSRVVPQACFIQTGVDYFGPLKVRHDGKTSKCWVALFTCLSSRAIHLELVMDLSAEEFLLAFKRFISRRGKPSKMLCDNGPQFKLVGKLTEVAWRKVFGSDEVTNFCSKSGISWTFIPEFAPYMGGVYERMVGVVKTSLRKTVSPILLSVKQLETALCECEATVNSRPLVPLDDEVGSFEVLTPAHFLTINPKIVTSDQGVTEEDSLGRQDTSTTAGNLIVEWKKGQRILNEFWKIWSGEYLNQLRDRSVYRHKHKSHSPIKPEVGHVVLLKGQGLPRGSWKMARVSHVFKSPDGEIRSVLLRLPNGRELRRPVSLLIPLEMSPSTPSQGPDTSEEDQRPHSPEL